MTTAWLPHTILRAASLLTPGDERAEWLKGWRSELWYVPRRGATRFSLGAFADALWVRRNSELPKKLLESPLCCLAFLTALAAVSCLIVHLLPVPHNMTPRAHLAIRDVPAASMAMLLFSVLILPAVLAIGWAPARRRAAPWPNRLRGAIFLALKIALVQPVMFCGFVLMVWIGPVLAPASQLATAVSWFLLFRWVLLDQRNRCPVCLRLLTDPVRIGAPSRTFLEWYGSESLCARGHGLLEIAEMPASYCASPQWRRLFSDAVEVRNR